jgi:hypothetical protein
MHSPHGGVRSAVAPHESAALTSPMPATCRQDTTTEAKHEMPIAAFTNARERRPPSMASAYYDGEVTRGWFVTGAFALLATAAIACGGDDSAMREPADGGASANGDASPNDAGASDAAPPCPLPDARKSELRGRVTILDGSDQPPPAAGARVCIHGHPDLPCVDALGDGTYEHNCVPTGDVAILFSHDAGRVLWLRVLVPGIPQALDTPIGTRAENVKLFAPAGVAYPQPAMGIVTLNDSLDSAKGGITFSAPAGSIGPFYSSDGSKITNDAGPSTGGGWAFVLVPAGDARFGLAGADPATICGQVSGGWGSGDGGITVPVLEDVETRVLVTCP